MRTFLLSGCVCIAGLLIVVVIAVLVLKKRKPKTEAVPSMTSATPTEKNSTPESAPKKEPSQEDPE